MSTTQHPASLKPAATLLVLMAWVLPMLIALAADAEAVAWSWAGPLAGLALFSCLGPGLALLPAPTSSTTTTR